METATSVNSSTPATGQNMSLNVTEFLACRLGKEKYGINIQKVQGVRGSDAVTAIANAPAHIKGVVNLRGTIFPIIDMCIKFNLDTFNLDAFNLDTFNLGTSSMTSSPSSKFCIWRDALPTSWSIASQTSLD